MNQNEQPPQGDRVTIQDVLFEQQGSVLRCSLKLSDGRTVTGDSDELREDQDDAARVALKDQAYQRAIDQAEAGLPAAPGDLTPRI